MKNLVIFGISETAERVYDFVVRYNLYNVIGFTVDAAYKRTDTFKDKPVWALEELEYFIDKENDYLFVAVFWNRLNRDRRNIYTKLKQQEYKFANIISPLASVRSKLVGENVWIMDYVVIQENAEIGDNVYIADFALVAHCSKIENHCFIAARAMVCGSCKIGEQTFVGVNSTIFDDTIVGERCIIGACTLVKRNVCSFTVCKTPSDVIICKQYSSEVIESKWLANHNVR